MGAVGLCLLRRKPAGHIANCEQYVYTYGVCVCRSVMFSERTGLKGLQENVNSETPTAWDILGDLIISLLYVSLGRAFKSMHHNFLNE